MAAVVLALGIGANNAVFTLVNAVLLRSLPFPESEQIMMVLTRDSRGRDLRRLGARLRRLAGVGAHLLAPVVRLQRRVQRRRRGPRAGELPRQLRVGELLQDARDLADSSGGTSRPRRTSPAPQPVVLISAQRLEAALRQRPGVIGRTIRLNAVNATIIGVMPEGMRFPNDADIWMPCGAMPRGHHSAPRQARGYFAIGRLRRRRHHRAGAGPS